jgi:hypothetical protein
MQIWARTDMHIHCDVEVETAKVDSWPDPCTLESVCQFCFNYGALNCVQEEKWRIVGAFFAGSVPGIPEGSTICGTNVRLRERPAGYFILGVIAKT